MSTPRTTRTRVASLIGSVIISVLVLTGCSSTTTPTATDAPAKSDSLLPTADGKTQYPLTLETPWGETVLNERPERIAAIGDRARDTELLAALGVTPVLAPNVVEWASWTLDALPAEIETIYSSSSSSDELYPLETIATTEPDLIIVLGEPGVGDYYDDLAAIAPVLAGKTDAEQENGTWQEYLQSIAEALDLSDAATTVVTDHENAFTAYRDEHPEFANKTVTFVTNQGSQYGLQYDSATGTDTEDFFLSLGFAPNPRAEEFVADFTVSNELISGLEADVLIVLDNTYGEEGALADLVENPLFEQLDAVQNDRVVLLTSINDDGVLRFSHDGVEYDVFLPWALYTAGPLGSQAVAELLVPILNGLLT